jgi:hypothetical protein
MKRAAVQWSIGRYLYSMDTVFVETEKRGRTTVIKKGQETKLNQAHQRAVQRIFNTKPAPDVPAGRKETAPQPASAAPPPVAPAPAAPPPVKNPAPAVTPSAAPERNVPENTYRVINAVIQQAMNGHNTLLKLEGSGGKSIMAYAQGTNPALVAGAWLENAVITSKIKEGVSFHILESFTLAAQQAA